MELDLTQSRSVLPVNGTYGVLTYTEHYVAVDLPASEDDVGFPEDDLMHVALWLPDVPEGVKVPVIMSIHPYYDFGGEGMPGVGPDSNPNTVPDGGIGKWVYDNFISHGYASSGFNIWLRKINSLPRCQGIRRTNRNPSCC